MVLACANTRHIRDQRLAFTIFIQPIIGNWLGAEVQIVDLESKHGMHTVLSWAFVGVLVVYINLLMRRRLRRLPPSLSRARFVRLGYLREMLSKGQEIRRCQDLPGNAFGFASVAAYVVILSHR